MPLIACSECGREVSDKAISCPTCGAPVTKVSLTFGGYLNSTLSGEPAKTSGARIGIMLLVSVPLFLAVLAWVLPKTEPKSAPKPADFSLPLYTRAFTAACPVSILQDHRQGFGLEAATHALGAVYGSADDLRKVGCDQWKGGVPLFVPPTEVPPRDGYVHWVAAYQSANFTGEPILVPSADLTN